MPERRRDSSFQSVTLTWASTANAAVTATADTSIALCPGILQRTAAANMANPAAGRYMWCSASTLPLRVMAKNDGKSARAVQDRK